ncbi:MAG: alpha/beta fold hydrolase [Verrucomicrobiota bacterium]|nr:alpha/beta fold hydrolase [Verrucomicrobiota bacterium]
MTEPIQYSAKASPQTAALLIGGAGLAVAGGFLFSISLPAAAVVTAIAVVCLWTGFVQCLNHCAGHFPGPLKCAVRHLYSSTMEGYSLVWAAVCYPFALLPSKLPSPNPQQTPVLLVHGYLHNGSGWLYYKRRLKAIGFDSVHALTLGKNPFRSIEDYAKVIQTKITQIKEATGRSDIILVGHSMGGLASSYYAANQANEDQITVKQVVTIGSPLKGSPLARLGPGRNAAQMRANSEFLTNLLDAIGKAHQAVEQEERRGTTFHHIGSKTDVVVPGNNALHGNLDDPNHNVLFKDLGHLGLLFSPRVADVVCNWVKS